MNILQAIVLGIVQGLSEFLPISSSGHLVLVQKLFGLTSNLLFFDVMLHVGTLAAVFAVLWDDIIDMLKHLFSKKPMYILLATLPTVIIALLLRKMIERSFGGQTLGIEFLITAVLLFFGERVITGKKGIAQMKATDALIMGTMQGLSIFPAISRSGATIVGGLFVGLDRKFAARFSFLMSIPAILGSLVLEGKDVLEAGIGSVDWLPILIGAAFAAVAGFFAIKIMLRVLEKGKLTGFALYVAILGVLVLLDQYVFHLYFTVKPF